MIVGVIAGDRLSPGRIRPEPLNCRIRPHAGQESYDPGLPV